MRRRLATSCALISLFTTIAALGPASPAPAQGSDACQTAQGLVEPVPICGTTTISGSESGYTLVDVPEGAVLDDDNIHIEGSGDFVGIMLTADPPYMTAPECGKNPYTGDDYLMCPNEPVEIRGLVPADFGGGPRFQFHSIGTSECNPYGHCVLEGSTYRLYLLADGSPVRVTIEFPELAGSVELSPLRHVHYDAREPDPALEPPDGPVYGAGFSGTLPTPGLEFAAAGVRTSARAGFDLGDCYYLQDPGDARLAYQPGCPAQLTGTDTIWGSSPWVAPALDSWAEGFGFVWPFPAGSAAVGGYTVAGGVPTKTFVTAFQLAFDETTPSSQGSPPAGVDAR